MRSRPDHAPDRRVVYLRGTSRNARRDREPSQEAPSSSRGDQQGGRPRAAVEDADVGHPTARALRGEGGAPRAQAREEPLACGACSLRKCGSSPRRSSRPPASISLTRRGSTRRRLARKIMAEVMGGVTPQDPKRSPMARESEIVLTVGSTAVRPRVSSASRSLRRDTRRSSSSPSSRASAASRATSWSRSRGTTGPTGSRSRTSRSSARGLRRRSALLTADRRDGSDDRKNTATTTATLAAGTVCGGPWGRSFVSSRALARARLRAARSLRPFGSCSGRMSTAADLKLSESARRTLLGLEASLPALEWRAVRAWLATFYRFQLSGSSTGADSRCS